MAVKETILVAGGAGYIGSTVCRLLVTEQYNVIVLDDLSSGHKQALSPGIKLYKGSTLDKDFIDSVFLENPDIKGVMNFAGKIEVGESVKNPSKYFYNNVVGSLNLIDSAKTHNIKAFIFSSSAAVYGIPDKVPILEDNTTLPINPYGYSKLQIEQILKYYWEAYNFKHVNLRYFNACGSYNGLGEDHACETHLIPNIFKAILGQESALNIFGNSYNTPDGTAIRDYIHIEDLAISHILALEALLRNTINSETFNVGSGCGYSIGEVIKTVEKVTSKKVPVNFTAPRQGDPPSLIADSSKIKRTLNWKPKHNLDSIIESAWQWHKNNPNGYQKTF